MACSLKRCEGWGDVHCHTTCTRDCPDACAVIARVENGRVVRLEGDADHPLTHGFLCKKTYQYPSRVYSSNRILHPLKRTKGGGAA